ncbi:MAG TPA: hypothetical protein VMS21_03030 [Methylomirabilota bacterium]|nr:hypothetical protein [Methylomirabilota bacterium]
MAENSLSTTTGAGGTRTSCPAWGWFLLLIVAPLVMLTGLVSGFAWMTVSALHLGNEGETLRDELEHATGETWRRSVELNVGGLPVHLARVAARWAPLEPGARRLLHSVRAVEFGVYRMTERNRVLGVPDLLHTADETLGPLGWERFAVVQERGQLIAVYVRSDLNSARDVRVRLIAFSGRGEVMMAGAHGNLEPLFDWVRDQGMLLARGSGG